MSKTPERQIGQYLSFELDGEEYGIDISRIREVLDYTRPTVVPRMPAFVRGIINLRGSVVPVVDLRSRFGMGQTGRTADTRIIIGEVEVDGVKAVLGTLADAVHEVMEMDSASIEPPPGIGTGLEAGFITGIGKRDRGFLMILDLDRVFSAGELARAGIGVGRVPEGAALAQE